MWKSIRKNNKTKRQIVENFNKIDNPLPRLIKGKKKKK